MPNNQSNALSGRPQKSHNNVGMPKANGSAHKTRTGRFQVASGRGPQKQTVLTTLQYEQ